MEARMLTRVLALIALLALSGLADAARPKEFYQEVSCTQANTVVDFVSPMKQVLLINDGANEAFFTVASGVATTAKTKLLSGDTLIVSWDGYDVTSIGVICSTGETATVRVYATQK